MRCVSPGRIQASKKTKSMPFHLMESKCRLQFKVGLKETIINESQSFIWCDKVRNVWYFYKHLIHCDSPTHTHTHMNERTVSVSGAFSTFINELYDDPKDKHSLQHSLSSIWFDSIRFEANFIISVNLVCFTFHCSSTWHHSKGMWVFFTCGNERCTVSQSVSHLCAVY